jgi:hypothetical protein
MDIWSMGSIHHVFLWIRPLLLTGRLQVLAKDRSSLPARQLFKNEVGSKKQALFFKNFRRL